VLRPGLGIDVLYDGACATCRREVRRLSRRGHRHPTRFVDGRDPASGGELADLLERLHGGADELACEGVQAVRAADADATGYGYLVAVTRVPGLSHGLVLGYRADARPDRRPPVVRPGAPN